MERSQAVAKESQDSLHQQFKNLRQEWDTFKESKPHPHPSVLRRCSTDSKSIAKTLQLMNNSPRGLMSCLQHERRSPSEAVEEILRERRVAIESAKLKGRSLFEGSESEIEMGFEGSEEICSEVRSVCSYGYEDESNNLGSIKEEVPPGCCYCRSYSAGSSVSDGKVEREEVVEEREKVENNVEEKRYGGGVGGNGGKWMLLMAWFTIALMVFTLGIISMKCNEGFEDEDGVTIVPT